MGNFYTYSCFTNLSRNRFYSDQITNDINFLLRQFLFCLVGWWLVGWSVIGRNNNARLSDNGVFILTILIAFTCRQGYGGYQIVSQFSFSSTFSVWLRAQNMNIFLLIKRDGENWLFIPSLHVHKTVLTCKTVRANDKRRKCRHSSLLKLCDIPWAQSLSFANNYFLNCFG
jgi:hypothetical protein